MIRSAGRCDLFRAAYAASARTGSVVAALLIVGAVACAGAKKGDTEATDGDSVFFSRHFDKYASLDNLTLMREGKVSIAPHGVTDIAGFTWVKPADVSRTWMGSMEQLRYLLPFIGSDREEDRDFAVEWYQGWATTHDGRNRPNLVAWGGMNTGVRAGILAYFLSKERGRSGGGIGEQLLKSLRDHRLELIEGEFEFNSNHGVWQAIGLIEVGRALRDGDAFELGVARLEKLAAQQVSALGFHLEHSPHYHFVFLRWLDEAITCLEAMPDVDGARLVPMREVTRRMETAGYYLQDHGGNMLPIGDTVRHPAIAVGTVDSNAVHARVKFDRDAGYACYKESLGPGSGRQVVFNIQANKGSFPYHFHEDALGLVVSYRGELLLGDQGGYDYGRSRYRNYVRGPTAHNVVVPTRVRCRSLELALDTDYVDDNDVVFTARRACDSFQFERTVRIAGSRPTVAVEDRVAGPQMRMFWNLGVDVVSVSAMENTGTEGSEYDRRWELVTGAGRVFEFRITSPRGDAMGEAMLYYGSMSPFLGWYSPSYGDIVKSRVFVVPIDAADLVSVVTSVRLVEDVK